jgi:putative DNA methylase
MTMEDIRVEGRAGRLGAIMTTVAVDGQNGKEYRLPTGHENLMAVDAEKSLAEVFRQIPFGLPEEPTPKGGSGASRAFSVDGYGFDQWKKLFNSRQLLALGTFVKWTRAAKEELTALRYPSEWHEAITAYLAIQNDKVADYNSQVCMWHISGEKIGHTFTRFALPITWDFVELALTNDVGGAYSAQLDWLSRYIDHALIAGTDAEKPNLQNHSAIQLNSGDYDAVVTDPPYYDAIPYSDLMDFFYLWLKRSLNGLSLELDTAFREPLSPKWSHEKNDGELIDDASRHNGDKARSKAAYEEGMARVFQECGNVLKPDGKMVVVFANKQPDAWETLVSALVRSGFVVDGSWPIQTEMSTRMRAKSSAALASSVWLVCKKRPSTAKPGWDNQVLEEMRQNIREKLREFWDAGIRGPDFVWAATGPAMEAYSKHPVVKKANEPGPMTVGEFLTHVRRMVVDFVVGRVLSGDKDEDADISAADRLDEPTAYYLLHRHDFGMDEAPAGACILYAISCGISDRELSGTWDLIGFTKGKAEEEAESEEFDADAESDAEIEDNSGSKVKLKTWAQRKGKSLGFEAPGGKSIPLIDRVHCLMHLWKTGDLSRVDGYLDANGLRRQELFKRLLQTLIELSPHGSEERSLLESLSNHIQARGAVRDEEQMFLPNDRTERDEES